MDLDGSFDSFAMPGFVPEFYNIADRFFANDAGKL